MARPKIKSWLGGWQEKGLVVSLLLALGISVGSVEKAQWVTTDQSLLLIMASAVLTGWLLSKSRLPVLAAHPVALLLGIAVTIWQSSSIFTSPKLTTRISQLASSLQSWWQALSTAEPSEGTVHFVVFLIFLTWVMSYISTWYTLRNRNPWVAVFLGATALLINLSNLPKQYFSFLFYYAIASLLLLGIARLSRDRAWFKTQDIPYPDRSAVYSVASLLCLSSLIVSIAWLTPEMRVERLETVVGAGFGKGVEKYFNNFFASIPAKQPILRSDEKSSLLFGDSSFDRGAQLQFVVISEQSLYLRARMYDKYSASGWTSSNATEHTHQQGLLNPETEEIAKLSQISYTVVPKLRTDILLNGGEFVSSSIPVSVQELAPANFNIDLTRRTQDGSLPPDVVSLAQNLRTARTTNSQIDADNVRKMLPPNLALTDFTNSQVSVERIGQVSRDTVAITSLYSLKPDRRYDVTTGISAATPEELSGTDGAYPISVTDYYLQLPPTFPERVRRLSETVTRQAKTRYDKVIAIKDYLSSIEYKLEVSPPPGRVDGVDYFLFSQRSGNCVQFASAMAVMLRSIGIPTRVLSGYTPGELDSATGTRILTAKERHAWPEVYFSGYGWVGFEATPGFNTSPGLGAGIDDAIDDPSSSQTPEELLEEDFMGGSLGIGNTGTTSGINLWPLIFSAQGILLIIVSIGGAIIFFIALSLFTTRQSRRLTSQDYISKVYREMSFFASLLGLSQKPQQTPLEYGARLASKFPLQAEAFSNIVQSYIESQYSPQKELGRWQGWRLQQSWREARRRLIRRRLSLR